MSNDLTRHTASGMGTQLIILVIAALLIILMVCIFLYRNIKKRDTFKMDKAKVEAKGYEGKITPAEAESEKLSVCTSERKAVSGYPEVKTEPADAERTSAVKYGRGFGGNTIQKKEEVPKETEEFFCCRDNGHMKKICPVCGVEHDGNCSTCELCGCELIVNR